MLAESISKLPFVELYDIPLSPVKCARTSAELGPLYVKTPVILLYSSDPSPPEFTALTYVLIVCRYRLVSSLESILISPAEIAIPSPPVK